METLVGKKMQEMGISPSLLNWGNDIVPSTKIWYDEKSSELCADCGVSIPVYESSDITQLLIEMEDVITKHYAEKGIFLESSYV